MEKISHRITLDVHKGGIQKVLRGMFTGDVLSRKIVISLVAGSAVCNMDENTAAVMYVTKPSGVTNYGACTVEGNLVTYDILPADIDEPGITQMQLKVVSGDMVLYAPLFSVEAQKNSSSDTPAENSPQFSALEQALAQVEEVYNKRIVSVEVEEDYTFVVTYADGETYKSDAFKALMEDIEKAEHERAEAEVARDTAEENRELAESVRVAEHSSMKQDIQSAIDANTALYNRVEELADEGLITESRVIEIIEEQGGGGGGGTVVLPDNVLVASDVTAADVAAPKINADLFGSLPPSGYSKSEELKNIINGTTPVGNAKTLDGHGAEYFAPLENLGGIKLFTSFPKGITNNSTMQELIEAMLDNSVLLVAGAGSPLVPENYTELLVFKTNIHFVLAYAKSQYTKNFYTGGISTNNSWSGWDKNTLSVDLVNFIKADGSNSWVSSVGDLDNFYTGITVVRYCKNVPNDNWWLVVSGGEYGTTVQTAYHLHGVETPKQRYCAGGTWSEWFDLNKDYIKHTEKPSGTYTGNGSAEPRTIATNGIGKVCVVNGGGRTAYVSIWGAIILSGTSVVALDYNKLNFNNGVLKVATTDYINDSGTQYTWDVM